LWADIGALAVLGGWIMDRKKHHKYIAEGDFGRVKSDLHDLGMAGLFATDFFIARVRQMATGVAGLHLGNPNHVQKDCFQTPKATTA
jgi:hypothetical protein